AWLLLRLRLPLWSGTAAALAVYMLLLSVHLFLRRAFLYEPAPASGGRWVSHAIARADAHQLPVEGEGARARAHGRPGKAPPPPDRRRRGTARALDRGPQGRAHDAFGFRPSREPGFPPPPPPPPLPPRSIAGADRGGKQDPEPAMSVEVIQDLIKKLADELN